MLLEKHFAPEITKNFLLEFEANVFNRKEAENIWKQVKDENLILEVRYKDGDLLEYICDVYSWETRERTEAHLLRYITDCYKSGKIGKDWIEKDGKLRVSPVIQSGELQTKTPDDVIAYNQLIKELGRKKQHEVQVSAK